ncbi:MAG TPA: class I SAM-dependent methyltransferase [Rhodothermales bacterium]|nr:class I SAM-dependent methyltransferase [Rhodothermales bacterium]
MSHIWPVLILLATSAMAWFVGSEATLPFFIYASWAGTLLMALAWWHGETWTMRTVLVYAILYRLVLLPVLPSLSDDGFRYIWDGLLQWKGINPFVFRPSDPALGALHNSDLYISLNSTDYFTVYPPVSQIVFGIGAIFYPFGWVVSYLVIKAVFISIEIFGVLLLSRMVQARSLILYAWNPLVLMEVAGQPHNEAMLVTWLLGTIWALQTNQPKWALVFATMAMWTKLYPLLLIPFVLNRTGWRYIWVPLLTGLVCFIPYYHSDFFVNIRTSLNLYTQQFEFGAGLYYWLKEWGRQIMGHEESKVLGPFLQWIFLFTIGALWVVDAIKQKSLHNIIYLFIGMFLLTATTVHPWYLLGLLAMIPLLVDVGFRDPYAQVSVKLQETPFPPWHWIWLGGMMTGNYFFYLTENQWPWVIAGWGGWFVLLLFLPLKGLLQRVQFSRAGRKYAKIRNGFPVLEPDEPLYVLDLGCGEGYLGEWIRQDLQANVSLVDVVDFNRTQIPFFRYDGQNLPFPDDAFDVTVMSFVLHHCENQTQVFQEAVRVTRKRILIIESVYITEWDLRQLTFLDTLANRLRSDGLMNQQEAFLHFRTVPEWYKFFKQFPIHLVDTMQSGLFLHQQAVFALEIKQTKA